MLSVAPFGAAPDDTGEFMLGDVLVTVVLMESSEKISEVNPNTENWTPALIAAAKQKAEIGIKWWEQTLATQFPNSPHHLQFHFDFTYADNPVLTDYEPIHLPSTSFAFWMYDFLNLVGYNQTGNFTDDIRAFNHSQRLAHGTDWAFTVFVVNDQNDLDGMFAPGGFTQAFAYPGGQFFVSPARRPASTFAHETGHMFWARDEYNGAGSYTDRRGYYNTQNWNAEDNPAGGQVISIMGRNPLTAAYNAYTSSPSSLAMIGWQDTSGNGIFDVLDVPHTLSGTGYVDPVSGQYRFVGASSVQTLPNLNSSGLQNDITLNKISRAEYRINGGPWQQAAVYDVWAAGLDLAFPVPVAGMHTVEIRTVDAVTGVSSPVFQGDTSRPASVLHPGINGFVWADVDGDGLLDNDEPRLAGWTVRLVNSQGVPMNLVQRLEPDDYALATVLNTVHPQVTLSLAHNPTGNVTANIHNGRMVFGNGMQATWSGEARLRANFATPVTTVRLEAIGTTGGDRARLEAYNQAGVLIGRYTTNPLANGQSETMQLDRPTADIAYVIAKRHSGTDVLLDNLRFGPETAVKTDAQGAYVVTSLPAGSYFVEAVSPSGTVLTNTRQSVILAAGESLGSVNLVAHTGEVLWQNPLHATDVTGDGQVTALDALVLINYINANGSSQPVPTSLLPPPYYDVDGNGFITAADVLVIINELNNAAASAGGTAEGSSGESSVASASEGESAGVWQMASMPPPAMPDLMFDAGRPAASERAWTSVRPVADRPWPAVNSPRDRVQERISSASRRCLIHSAEAGWDDGDVEDLLRILADDVAAMHGRPRA